MQEYVVGGAVRDYFLGRDTEDRDYVVVGSTVDEMLELGFTQVGADFPVFLDESGDEYALARTERKTGEGYLGFDTRFGPDVTLEDDLSRRDLTVNSMAMDSEFNLFDPFGGFRDLEAKVLRHTSEAFVEDPVRVLRLARFRARFGPEWKVAEETMELVFHMAKSGVLNELKGDRVFKEFSRAMMEDHPRLFFDTLYECDALHVLFPEVYQLLTATERLKWHPEGNSYEHTMLVLTQAVLFNGSFEERLAAQAHDFGKALSPKETLPAHHGHEKTGVPVVKAFCDRNRVPTKARDRAMKATRYHMLKVDQVNPKTLVRMFDSMNALNDPRSVEVLHFTMKCDHRGRLGHENANVDYVDYLLEAFETYKSVKYSDVFGPDDKPSGERVKQRLYQERVKALREMV